MTRTPPSCLGCSHPVTRRQWIQRLAMSSAVYAGVFGGTASAAIPAEFLVIDVNAFPDLVPIYGSAIISHDGGITKILINKESETDYYALDPRCPHMGCQVARFSIATNTNTCPCHGSQFDISGRLLSGPARTNLLTYATQLEGTSTLKIEVPGLVLRMDSIGLESTSGATRRMRLTFPTITGSQYYVRYTEDLKKPFQIVNFSNTSAGLANKTIVTGTGATKSIYVDSSGNTGFFVLELIVSQFS